MGLQALPAGPVLPVLVMCTDTALRLRAEPEGINPSQTMPISHLIQQFIITASYSVFTEAFSRAGLNTATGIASLPLEILPTAIPQLTAGFGGLEDWQWDSWRHPLGQIPHPQLFILLLKPPFRAIS